MLIKRTIEDREKTDASFPRGDYFYACQRVLGKGDIFAFGKEVAWIFRTESGERYFVENVEGDPDFDLRITNANVAYAADQERSVQKLHDMGLSE